MGKVCMDLNDTVPEYKESTEESVKETERYRAWGFHRVDGVGNRERKVDTISTQLRSEHSDRLFRLLQCLVSLQCSNM